ncbi:hypothetical protein [Haladaptatus sp. NG-SE-30]
MATDEHETDRNEREESTDDTENERQQEFSRGADPSRYEGQRRPERTSRRPESHRPEPSGRVQHRREMRERAARASRPRQSERRRESESSEERPEESTEEEVREPTDVPKYGGPRDPDWERRRMHRRQEGRDADVRRREADTRSHDAEIRQYERRASAALARQRDLQRDKSGRRYHRGRRG